MAKIVNWLPDMPEDELWVCPACDAHLHVDCVADKCPACGTPATDERDEVWKARIAGAVTVAMNEAYERAAKVAEGGIYADINPDVTIPLTGPEIAHFIRALKTEGT